MSFFFSLPSYFGWLSVALSSLFSPGEPKQPNYCVQPSQTPHALRRPSLWAAIFFFFKASTDRVLGQLRLTKSCKDSEPGIGAARAGDQASLTEWDGRRGSDTPR